MQSKQQRQINIKDLILTLQIPSHEALQKELELRGISVTQATLSRDLNELGVVKLSDRNGAYYYSLNLQASPAIEAKSFECTLSRSGNIAVLRTAPGQALSMATEIDQQEHLEILGTVAGYDTIFLVIAEDTNPLALHQLLCMHIPGLVLLDTY